MNIKQIYVHIKIILGHLTDLSARICNVLVTNSNKNQNKKKFSMHLHNF